MTVMSMWLIPLLLWMTLQLSMTIVGSVPMSDVSIAARIAALLANMSVAEKARQLDLYHADEVLVNGSVSVDRTLSVIGADGLGIGLMQDLYPPTARLANDLQKIQANASRNGVPILFTAECLHGLQQPGHSTFPAGLNMGSTFNKSMTTAVARAIGREARAFGIRWCLSPVLGIAREPRWGRTEETMGEDPYLTSCMARAYVLGMQGASADNRSVVSEVKHFAAHSIPEGGRNAAATHLGLRELEEVFLPPFKAAVKAGALGVMSAYSEYDGVPCTGSPYLLTDKLRREWGFRGVVLSDLGAVGELYNTHAVAETPKDAVIRFVTSGGNVQFYDFSHEQYQGAIIEGVADGSLPMEILDARVADVLRVKMLLQLDTQPMTDESLAERTILNAEHRAVSLLAAKESIVLLKNDMSILPISLSKIKRIAVVGPMADRLATFDYYGPSSSANTMVETTLLQGIKEFIGDETIRVTHSVATYMRVINESVPIRRGSYIGGITAKYYTNMEMKGTPTLVRTEAAIDFNWYLYGFDETNRSPYFSAQFDGVVEADMTNPHAALFFETDSGFARLFIDDRLVIDAWTTSCTPCQIPFPLVRGRQYKFHIDFRTNGYGSLMLLWDRVGNETFAFETAISEAAAADVVIVAVGDSGGDGLDEAIATCGEGIDRSTLELTGRQEELIFAALNTSVPVVVVLFSGRSPAIPAVAASAHAILECFAPAQSQGTAIADVLFGAYNPAGRLPLSYPVSVGQLPIFYNYKPSARTATYWDIPQGNTPVYAFGHGLSYTAFHYGDMTVQPQMITTTTATVNVSFQLTNIGAVDGDEVPQLYIRDQYSSVTTPVQQLRGFERIFVRAKQTVLVSFTVDVAEDLSLFNYNNQWEVEPGNFTLWIAAASDDHRLESWIFVKQQTMTAKI